MWLVAHTASGLVASAGWVAARRPHPKQRRHPAIYGLILGAVLPDFDVFGAVALILAGWRASQAIAAAHHIVAHNLPFVALLAVSGGLLNRAFPRAARFTWGLSGGVVLHLLGDLLPGSVPLMWPFSHARYGLRLLRLSPQGRFFYDIHGELAAGLLFFLVVWWWLRRRQSDGHGARVALISALYCLAVLVYAAQYAASIPDITFDTPANPLLGLLAVPFIVAIVVVSLLWWREGVGKG